MEIATERRDGVLLVPVSGRIDDSSASAFVSTIGAAIEDGDYGVLIDLENLTGITNAGLRLFPSVARRLRGGGTKLAICAMPDWLRRVFERMGFDRVIPVHPSRAEALSCLAPERPGLAGNDGTPARLT